MAPRSLTGTARPSTGRATVPGSGSRPFPGRDDDRKPRSTDAVQVTMTSTTRQDISRAPLSTQLRSISQRWQTGRTGAFRNPFIPGAFEAGRLIEMKARGNPSGPEATKGLTNRPDIREHCAHRPLPSKSETLARRGFGMPEAGICVALPSVRKDGTERATADAPALRAGLGFLWRCRP